MRIWSKIVAAVGMLLSVCNSADAQPQPFGFLWAVGHPSSTLQVGIYFAHGYGQANDAAWFYPSAGGTTTVQLRAEPAIVTRTPAGRCAGSASAPNGQGLVIRLVDVATGRYFGNLIYCNQDPTNAAGFRPAFFEMTYTGGQGDPYAVIPAGAFLYPLRSF